MQTIDSISLYYREGSSDKVYQAAIEPKDDQFVVSFAYGRRGSTLTIGTKTSSPMDYDSAKAIFEKLVKEKKAKGYTEGADGTPYQHSDKEASGVLPQLLNPIDESEVKGFIVNDRYCAQEKYDGRHLLVRKVDDRIEGINKKGLVIGLPQSLHDEIATIAGDFILDGEVIGEKYYVFDCLEYADRDFRKLPYRERLDCLIMLLSTGIEHPNVNLVDTAYTTRQKNSLWERLQHQEREGIVFKDVAAPYTSGRPNSGGAQVKFKFVATASAIVAKVNQKRSVELGLFNGRTLVSCGNVTIPANHEIPAVGAIVEVRYLYAYRESLALYQPVYLGLREEVEAGECTVQQLKFKSED